MAIASKIHLTEQQAYPVVQSIVKLITNYLSEQKSSGKLHSLMSTCYLGKVNQSKEKNRHLIILEVMRNCISQDVLHQYLHQYKSTVNDAQVIFDEVFKQLFVSNTTGWNCAKTVLAAIDRSEKSKHTVSELINTCINYCTVFLRNLTQERASELFTHDMLHSYLMSCDISITENKTQSAPTPQPVAAISKLRTIFADLEQLSKLSTVS